MSAGYTDADVQLVADAMAEANCHCPPGSRCAMHEVEARAAVEALAGAGRLTPDGALVREEWALKVGYPSWGDRREFVIGDENYGERSSERVLNAARWHRGNGATPHVLRREITTGPWVEADEDGTG